MTLGTLRTLLRMIEEKTRLVQLLDACMGSGGLTVVIGSEHHAADLQRFSLVASTYSDGTAPAPSASSARRACGIRAPSTPSRASQKPSIAW